MTFCPSCGAERKEGSKFCHNCGYDFEAVGAGTNTNNDENTNSNFNAQVDQNPIPKVQAKGNSHTLSKILGYISALLIPLFGLIFGIYLYTRDDEDAKKHAKLIIGFSIIMWILYSLALN